MSVGVGKETTEVGATVVNVAGTDVCVEVGSKEEEVGKTSTEKVQAFSTSMINSQVLNNINHLYCFIIFSLSAIS